MATNFQMTQTAAPATANMMQAAPAASSPASAGPTLTFALDTPPGSLDGSSDYLILCAARPNAANPLARTLVLTPNLAEALDAYAVQCGRLDCLDAIFQAVQSLAASNLAGVQTAQATALQAVTQAVSAEVVEIE